MSYRGHVREGVIVLEEGATLPDGVKVRIDLDEGPEDDSTCEETPTLYDRLAPIIGKAKGLPPDLARNHDHYLHGRPKK
jgi:hypothetical protein